MSDVVGKATLEVGADVSGLQAGFREGERAIKSLEATAASSGRSAAGSIRGVGDAATDTAQRMDAQSRRFLASLERQADRAGKTASEYAALRASQLGVADAAAPLVERLRATEAAMAKGGVSAAQTAAALRLVPAQLTDIVTQLAGGQSALLILTQQGGQLKDMFGGVVPAARALTSHIAGMINPATAAAAALGLVGAAAYIGAQEQTAYQKALVTTGNYAGTTANQLSVMAGQISQAIGTQGQAADVLVKLAGSGKIAAGQFESLVAATIAWEKASGTAVDESVKRYVELGDEPVKASLKLNEQYHYLTDAVYQQIRALEEQGSKEEAAALAQRTYADAMGKRANEILANLGLIERGWGAVTGAAKSAWDAMLGLGRPDTLPDIKGRIAAVRAEIERLGDGENFGNTQGGAATGGSDRRRAGAQARLRALLEQERALEAEAAKARADAERQRGEEETIAARARLDAQAKATRSRAEQRADELRQLREDAAKVGLATEEYNKRAAAIEAKYKDRGARPKAYVEDYATRYLDQLRQTGAALQAQTLDADKLTAAEKARAEFAQQLADIKTKQTLTADQKSLLARKDEILAQLDLNVATEKAALARREETKELERQARLLKDAQTQAEGVAVRIRESAIARGEQFDRQLGAFGMGALAQEQITAQRGVYREFERIRTDWIKSMTDRDLVGTDLYTQELTRIKDAEREALAQVGQYYDQLALKREDWRNGAMAAMADYRDYSANVADQTGRLFGGMFQGLEDSVVEFAMTGKASFGDFAKSVIADLARIQARAAISGLVQMGIGLVGSLFSAGAGAGAASTAGSAWGGFSTGPATTGYTGAAATGTFGNGLSGVFVSGARADGGPVAAGSTYLVGERGPELFKPNQSGTIVPNHALGGGGDININTHVSVDNGGVQAQSDSNDALSKQLGSAINAAVTERLSREMRQGGMLWRMRNGQA
ncbi:phage tail tape measure protein [Cupriavidus respiraculi]|uniref:Phage tail tape measure protein n=1 Tax=Cupriavidus respiraculi TaxID=195930 RepID=A0ABN7ZF40_9BURK|nr:phage tail tape measure protein [Cupriavidus respiraculi]CAG9184294.1 hypothetical protein LMG21510_05061 [Cupriavidus respiraculi]